MPQDGASVLEAAARSALDVNDVSYLFPLPADEAGIGNLVALAEDPRGTPGLSRADLETLAPLSRFKWLYPHQSPNPNDRVPPPSEPQMGAVPNPQHAPGVWKVVGIRLNPCAKDDPAAASCRAEFRLVLQPVLFDKGVTTADQAIHLIYEVDPAQRAALVADVMALKRLAGAATAGVPLGVHPVMKAEGLNGPYAAKLREMVKAYAKSPQLRVATHMMTEDQDRWTFLKTLPTGGKLRNVPIPFVERPAKPMAQLFFTDGSPMFAVQDKSSARDNVNDLVDDMPGRPFAHPSQALVDAALRLDNPLVHGPGTTDCASCHIATRALLRSLDHGPAYVGAADGNPNRFAVPAGLTGRLDTDPQTTANLQPWSTRNFGYFDALPSVNQGAINESALIADRLTRGVD